MKKKLAFLVALVLMISVAATTASALNETFYYDEAVEKITLLTLAGELDDENNIVVQFDGSEANFEKFLARIYAMCEQHGICTVEDCYASGTNIYLTLVMGDSGNSGSDNGGNTGSDDDIVTDAPEGDYIILGADEYVTLEKLVLIALTGMTDDTKFGVYYGGNADSYNEIKAYLEAATEEHGMWAITAWYADNEYMYFDVDWTYADGGSDDDNTSGDTGSDSDNIGEELAKGYYHLGSIGSAYNVLAEIGASGDTSKNKFTVAYSGDENEFVAIVCALEEYIFACGVWTGVQWDCDSSLIYMVLEWEGAAEPENHVQITQQPKSVTVAKGATAKVTVKAEGDGLTYKWYYKNAGASKFSYTSSFTGSSYSIQMTGDRAGRQVYCVITDAYGNSVTSDTVTLDMEAGVEITQQPKSVTVAKGTTAKVTVQASGEGLTYKWYYKNAGSSKFTYTKSFTGSTYSVQMSADRAGRQVYCVVTDKNGNTVKSDVVTLSMEAGVTITTQPKSVTVAKGATAKVTVQASGEGLTYKWYYKNAGSSKFTYTKSFTGSTYSVQMSADRAGRQVYCVVTDKNGNTVKSDVVTLSMASGVTITTQPKSVTVTKGATAKVTVQASGEGLTYKWYYKNAGSSKFTYTKSFTGSTYSVQMSADRAGRQVYCVVTDKNGNTVKSDVVTLGMSSGVTITTQPKSVTVTKGATAKVTVQASGEGLTYKWYYKNAGSSKFTYTKSFTGSTYSVQMNAERAGRQVYCVVTDKNGNTVKTEVVTLNMK